MIFKPCKPVDGLYSFTKTFLKFRNEIKSANDNLLDKKLKSRINDIDFLIDRKFAATSSNKKLKTYIGAEEIKDTRVDNLKKISTT